MAPTGRSRPTLRVSPVSLQLGLPAARRRSRGYCGGPWQASARLLAVADAARSLTSCYSRSARPPNQTVRDRPGAVGSGLSVAHRRPAFGRQLSAVRLRSIRRRSGILALFPSITCSSATRVAKSTYFFYLWPAGSDSISYRPRARGEDGPRL